MPDSEAKFMFVYKRSSIRVRWQINIEPAISHGDDNIQQDNR